MQIHHNALILVADGQRCRFLRNQGSFTEPRLVVEGEREHISAPTHRLGTDQPGRAFSSVGSIRSAVEQTDFHQIEKDRFAAKAAEMLNRRARGKDFEELIVVAPPGTLAELRANYDREVSARLVAEIDKDLTNHDIGQITAILVDRER